MTDDFYGLFHQTVKDNTFLTVDNMDFEKSIVPGNKFPFDFEMIIKLSNKTVEHNR